eukprot:4705973-Prymnesium_polylepis.1
MTTSWCPIWTTARCFARTASSFVVIWSRSQPPARSPSHRRERAMGGETCDGSTLRIGASLAA